MGKIREYSSDPEVFRGSAGKQAKIASRMPQG